MNESERGTGREGTKGWMSEWMDGWMSEPVGRLVLGVVTEVSQPRHVSCAHESRELDMFSFSALAVLAPPLPGACRPLPAEVHLVSLPRPHPGHRP